MKKSSQVKIVTHVPIKSLDIVQKAIWKVGAGRQWNYSHCSFVMKGVGFFTPECGAMPTIWKIWKAEKVDEYHLEFTCEKSILKEVITELKKAHPYEEVPIQIFEYFEV